MSLRGQKSEIRDQPNVCRLTSDFRFPISDFWLLAASFILFLLDFLDSDLVKVYKKAYLELGKGDVAQLGERSVRNAEVVGSNPIVSTKEC